jgi:hypothetical protein
MGEGGISGSLDSLSYAIEENYDVNLVGTYP